MHLLNFVSPGLQIGFFLERAGRDYIIFERDGLAGLFLKDNGTLLLRACFNVKTSYSKTQL